MVILCWLAVQRNAVPAAARRVLTCLPLSSPCLPTGSVCLVTLNTTRPAAMKGNSILATVSPQMFFFVAWLLACLIFSLQSAYEAITVIPRTVPHGPHWLIHFRPNIKEVELLSCGPEDLVSSPVLHVSPDPFPKPLLMTPLPAKVLLYTNKSKLEICLSYWSNSVVIKIVFV